MEADKISYYRLQKTFDASKTSYRLLMFLNLFRKTIDRGTGKNKKSLTQLREELFDAHGAPPRGTAARLAADIKALQNVKNFPEFIKIMGLPYPVVSCRAALTKSGLTSSLLDSGCLVTHGITYILNPGLVGTDAHWQRKL